MKFRAALALVLLIALAAPAQAATVLSKGYTASATNANASVVLAAKTAYQWDATSIAAGCATTPASPVLLTIKDGATTVFSTYITTPVALPLGDLGNTPNNSMTATLAACGSGVVGSVNLVAKQL